MAEEMDLGIGGVRQGVKQATSEIAEGGRELTALI